MSREESTVVLFDERLPAGSVETAARRLAVVLEERKGARIGECAVVSRQVHTYDPQKPEVIQILQNSDAGQTFYHRRDCGRILHVDIFHECGRLRPEPVAQALREVIAQYNVSEIFNGRINPDAVDLQTGEGGGRITGKLVYGKKDTLCKAHENHVHMAIMLSREALSGLFYMVHAVEQVILTNQLELRRNEKIIQVDNPANSKLDMSDYATDNDSLLTGDQAAPEEEDENELDQAEDEDKSLQSSGSSEEAGKPPTDARHGNPDRAMGNTAHPKECNEQKLVSIAEEKPAALHLVKQPDEEVANCLVHALVCRNPDKMAAYLKKIQRNGKQSNRLGQYNRSTLLYSRWEVSKKLVEKPGEEITSLNISETVHAAACRKMTEANISFSITKNDLRHYIRCRRNGNDICLVIDASSSMGGKRIQAAKMFAGQLLARVRGRIGIVTFQNSTAEVRVPLTRNYQQLTKGLQGIQTSGRTPLALGLQAGFQHLRKAKADKGVLILITDGLPDGPDCTTQQSVDDALLVARQIKKQGYRLIAIGLRPYQDYLARLSQEADGVVYVFDTINSHLLNYETIAENLL